MNAIEMKDRRSLEMMAAAMDGREPFALVTEDKDFNPLGHDLHSAHVWIAVAGGGLLMTIGGGALIAAFLTNEPISKLGLLIGGGLVLSLTGGLVLASILMMRSGYQCEMEVEVSSGKYCWVLRPKAA